MFASTCTSGENRPSGCPRKTASPCRVRGLKSGSCGCAHPNWSAMATGDSPLVLDDKGRLYLQRLYRDERQLAEALRSRALAEPSPFSITRADEVGPLLERYFKGPPPDGGPDWQKVAAVATILKKLCIISGAPGTGKTTTVAKILGVLLEMTLPRPLRIHLCTPTGKAAARLGGGLGRGQPPIGLPSRCRCNPRRFGALYHPPPSGSPTGGRGKGISLSRRQSPAHRSGRP